MNLIELYRAIIGVAKLTADDQGYISSVLMDNKEPFIVSGKRMVLPTSYQLRNPDTETRIVFHPLRESALQTTETEVLNAFRTALNNRLNSSLALLFTNMILYATSVAEQKKLNDDQMKYLVNVGEADKDTFEVLTKLLQSMPLGQSKNAFINIYLKRGGRINNVAYKKAAIVSFPLLEELNKEGKEVFGVKMRKKDRLIFKNLMNYIFPAIDASHAEYKEEGYNAGSNSNVAPSLESIMSAVRNIGTPINQLASLFEDVFDDCQEIMIPSDWDEPMQNIEAYLPEIRMIPSQIPIGQSVEQAQQAQQPQVAPSLPTLPTIAAQPAPVMQYQPINPVQQSSMFSQGFAGIPNQVQPIQQNMGLADQLRFAGLPQTQQPVGMFGQPQGMMVPVGGTNFSNQPMSLFGQPQQQGMQFAGMGGVNFGGSIFQ